MGVKFRFNNSKAYNNSVDNSTTTNIGSIVNNGFVSIDTGTNMINFGTVNVDRSVRKIVNNNIDNSAAVFNDKTDVGNIH